MKYVSTRGESKANSTYEALLKGLADDGGLFVPEQLNKLSIKDDEIKNFEYKDYALKVISTIFDDIEYDDLKVAIDEAYNTFEENILPISKVGNSYIMELYHGQTFAFKDFALSLLPRLISLAVKKTGFNKKIIVLTATSGDTGSAALYGFKNVKNTDIIVFYPTEGISKLQRAQMNTIDGNNTYAIAIKGNFDDAQSALKEIFNNIEFRNFLEEKGYVLSSANSINIGRLVPQVAYYFYSYYQLVRNGEINNGEIVAVSVPTGNFGNILATYIAKKMGLPIKDLICASNKNNVLTDFINTGNYNTNREFYITNTPSMDILVSSNLERFLYYELGENPKIILKLMNDLKTDKEYNVDKELCEIFANSYDDNETLEEVKYIYDEFGYLVDTHTAIATKAAREYSDKTKNKVLVASTASPFKFAGFIAQALGIEYKDEFDALEKMNLVLGLDYAKDFLNLLNKKVTQDKVIDKNNILDTIKEIIK